MRDRVPYLKIVAAIRADIAAGRLQVGDMLPSRPQLAAEHEVAEMTVSNAIRALKDEGLVRGERGRGIFVAAAPGPVAFEVVQIADPVHECGVCSALV